MQRLYHVPRGHQITVSAGGAAPAHARQVEDSSIAAVVYSAAVFGPYLVDKSFVVTGDATATVAEVGTVLPQQVTTNAGTPADAAQATLGVNPTGDDNALTFTAREYGAAGNAISVAYLDPGANDAALAVSVDGSDITVSLATGGGGAITSTAAQVKAAIEASTAAARLVTVAIDTTDSGTADDGSGVVTARARAWLASGAGTSIGVSLPGALLIDTSAGKVYRNSGTQAAPAWTELADVS